MQDSKRSVSLLVIDPDPHGRDLIKHFLAKYGLKVSEATDGETGLAIVLDQRPALVITEILLAKLDGLNLCRQIKQQTEDTGVVVLSFLLAEERALEAGADLFLAKPIQQERLFRVIDKLLTEHTVSELKAS